MQLAFQACDYFKFECHLPIFIKDVAQKVFKLKCWNKNKNVKKLSLRKIELLNVTITFC